LEIRLEDRWDALTHGRVLGVGSRIPATPAFAHGRYTARRRVDPEGTVHTGLVERPNLKLQYGIKTPQ
jgi:hypothetical protein